MGSNTLGTALDTFLATGGAQNLSNSIQQSQAQKQQQQRQSNILQILGGIGGTPGINPNEPNPVSPQIGITGGLSIPDALPADLGGQPVAASQSPVTPEQQQSRVVDRAVSIAELQKREQDQKRAQSLKIADAAIKLSFLGEEGAQTANFLLQNQDAFVQPDTKTALSEIKSIMNSASNTMILEDENAALEQILAAGNAGLLSTEAKAILNNNIDKANPGESIRNLSAVLNQGRFAEIDRQEALDIRQIREQGRIDQARKETPERIITESGNTGALSDDSLKEFTKADRVELEGARTEALTGQQLSRQIQAVQSLVDSGFNSGLFAAPKAFGSALSEAFGLTDGEFASKFQNFQALSKDLGIKKLAFIGGSDTERELAVAIQTNPNPNNTEAANKAIIDRSLKAISIVEKRPEFIENWLIDNGNLNAKNNKGQTLSEAWREFQTAQFNDSNIERTNITAVNPQTGQRIMSTDGGATWQPLSN